MKIKHLSAFCFAIAFLLAMNLFLDIGRSYISSQISKNAFIITGVLGLFLNLMSYKSEKNKKKYDFLFWIGCILLFVGFLLKMKGFIFSDYILIFGVLVVGISFFYTPNMNEKEELIDLLDDPKEEN